MAKKREFEIVDNRDAMYVPGGGKPSLNQLPDGLSMWNPKKPGTYLVEFLAYQVTEAQQRLAPGLRFSKPGAWYKERTYHTHSGIGPDNQTYTCPQHTFGNRCPICDERQRLKQIPSEEADKRQYGLRHRDRQLWLLVERDERTREITTDIMLWDVAVWCWDKQLKQFLESTDREDRAAYSRFFHPEVGLTVKMVATEESAGEKGKYLKFTPREFKARKDDLPDELVFHGFDLDTIPRLMKYSALQQAFDGMDVDPDAKDEDSTPVRGRAREREEDSRPLADGPARGRSGGGPAGASGADTPARRRPPVDPDEDTPPPSAARADSIPRGERGAKTSEDPPRKRHPADDDDGAPAGVPKKLPFASRDVVSFLLGGTRVEGIVVSINSEKETARVSVEGYEAPIMVEWEEVTVVVTDDTFDAKPEGERRVLPAKKSKPAPADDDGPPAKSSPRGKWDDDEEPAAPPPRGERGAKPPADPPGKKSPAADLPDEEPPPPARRAKR